MKLFPVEVFEQVFQEAKNENQLYRLVNLYMADIGLRYNAAVSLSGNLLRFQDGSNGYNLLMAARNRYRELGGDLPIGFSLKKEMETIGRHINRIQPQQRIVTRRRA